MNSPDQDPGAALDAAIHELRGPTHALGLILHLLEREDQDQRAHDPSLLPRARRILSRISGIIDSMEEISCRLTQAQAQAQTQDEATAEEGPAPTPAQTRGLIP